MGAFFYTYMRVCAGAHGNLIGKTLPIFPTLPLIKETLLYQGFCNREDFAKAKTSLPNPPGINIPDWNIKTVLGRNRFDVKAGASRKANKTRGDTGLLEQTNETAFERVLA